MSIVQSALSWLKNTIGWSNSRQSWEERIGALGLSAIAFLLVWLSIGGLVATEKLVLFWGVWALAAALLLRRGLLKLFGPVLFYDMLCLARRGRYFWLRLGYALLLVMFLFMTWAEVSRGGRMDHHRNSLLAEIFFAQFIFIQLIAVSMLTPAYVAGSIAEEKDRKTLEFMLATDLRNREIVLSKLFARLSNLTLIILTGLPILSMLQFLGGVDPNLVLAGFWATLMTMLGLGGFSILASVQLKKPRDAIALAYLGPLTYIALGLVAFAFQKAGSTFFAWSLGWWDDAPTLSEVATFFNSGNIAVALIDLMIAIDRNALQTELTRLVWSYSIFHLIVGLGCTTWAVLRLRAIALEQAHGTTQKAGLRHRLRPEVGALPMFWKEMHVEGNMRSNWLSRIFVVLLFLVSVGGILVWIGYDLLEGEFFDDPESFHLKVNIWVRVAGAAVASLMLLGATVRASTAISSERDKDTLDSLLTTPLDSDTILWGKFWGCLLSMRRGLVWLGALWGVGVLTGSVQVFALPLLCLALAIYGSAFTILGLWFSMASKSSMRATIWAVMATVGITLGHWLLTACCAAVGNSGNDMEIVWKFQAGMTPPFVLGLLPLEGSEFRHDRREFLEFFGFALFGMFLYALASFFCWAAFLSPEFRRLTHREILSSSAPR